MTFPRLRTNAIAQYPLRTHLEFRTRILLHVDGTEQRFPQFAKSERSWIVLLQRLDDQELAVLRQFYLDVQRSGMPFAFTDGDGVVHPECYFAGETFETSAEGESQLAAKLIIRRK